MKLVLRFTTALGLMVAMGCQSPESDSLSAAARRGLPPTAVVHFARGARVYEEGDALFAMVNGTSQVLWFVGQGPDSPSYRTRIGAAITAEQNAPAVGRSSSPERFPLVPGETRYFEIKAGQPSGPLSIGMTFYPSRTGTNGVTVWSAPVPLPPKPRALETQG